ncbi:MAG: hypothetical protein ACRDS1_16840 [Pseudonocardiaceae bacterium]
MSDVPTTDAGVFFERLAHALFLEQLVPRPGDECDIEQRRRAAWSSVAGACRELARVREAPSKARENSLTAP